MRLIIFDEPPGSAGVPPASREPKPEFAGETPALPGIALRFMAPMRVQSWRSKLPRKTDSGDSRQGGGDGESRGKNDCPPEPKSKTHIVSAAHQKAFAQQALN